MRKRTLITDEIVYTVADLAEEFNITARAVRWYESKGLIQSRRVGRSMFYDRRQRARLKIVMRSKRVGFSLEATKAYLDLYEADKSNPEHMLAMLSGCQSRLHELEAQRQALEDTIEELKGVEQAARDSLVALKIDPDSAVRDYEGEHGDLNDVQLEKSVMD